MFAPHKVAFLLFPGVAPFDVAGPAQAFGAAGRGVYEQEFFSLAGGEIKSDSGLSFHTQAIATAKGSIDTMVLPGGYGVARARSDPEFLAAVRRLEGRSKRVVSICVGAFLSAEAGFLRGRRATTHWRACQALAAEYPDIKVEPDAVFVRDGDVWSSAGISAGVDLTLALIEQDRGRVAAMTVARELVVFLRRSGGQSQFSTVLAGQVSGGDRFSDLFAWISANVGTDLPVDRLAEQVKMSPRSFARHFQQRTGLTPAKAIEKIRIEAAKSMLERGDKAVPVVAAACGFGDEQRMRRAFARQLGVTPAEWRDRFAAEH
jgi:transcriptional regulator GlxA family with amidase domain